MCKKKKKIPLAEITLILYEVNSFRWLLYHHSSPGVHAILLIRESLNCNINFIAVKACTRYCTIIYYNIVAIRKKIPPREIMAKEWFKTRANYEPPAIRNNIKQDVNLDMGSGEFKIIRVSLAHRETAVFALVWA